MENWKTAKIVVVDIFCRYDVRRGSRSLSSNVTLRTLPPRLATTVYIQNERTAGSNLGARSPLAPLSPRYFHAVIPRKGEAAAAAAAAGRDLPRFPSARFQVRPSDYRDIEAISISRPRYSIHIYMYTRIYALALAFALPLSSSFCRRLRRDVYITTRNTSLRMPCECVHVGRSRISSFLGNHRPEVVRKIISPKSGYTEPIHVYTTRLSVARSRGSCLHHVDDFPSGEREISHPKLRASPPPSPPAPRKFALPYPALRDDAPVNSL